MRLRWFLAFGLGLLMWDCCSQAWALPAYRRLWERTYGYNVSCGICHVRGGGSELTGYGKDFQRFGTTPGAFKAIADRDSDRDGVKNLDEIRAKSNPGDPRSTPTNLTDWLQRIEESMLPLEQLGKLFPGAKMFSSMEGTLSDSQIQQVEGLLGSRLSEEDAVPTFYFAVEKQGNRLKRTGVSLFVALAGGKDKLIVGVAADLSGNVISVILVQNKLDKRLAERKFLEQFIGKSANDPLTVGKDIESVPELESPSVMVAGSVKKALLVINTVFSKNGRGQ
ncbi:MAG: hypothetical protein QME66_08780 [Candidatus Eisenbacteria bacterium]|nr:hypothetical protein [Candidatus Eisenbacteria bacterium]